MNMEQDPVSDIISAAVIDRFYLATLDFSGTWGLKFDEIGGIKFTVLSKGHCCMKLGDTGETIYLNPGDCILMTQGAPFSTLSSAKAACVNPSTLKQDLSETEAFYTNGGRDVHLQGGRFFFSEIHDAILRDLLPRFICLRAEETGASLLKPLIDRFVLEVRNARPGRTAAIHNLARMMVLEIIRFQLEKGRNHAGNILSGLSDRRIGKAVHAIHDLPGKAWTVENLALAAGMSRSNFAARFRLLVGIGPIEYLTQWRMALACSSLTTTAEAISEIAYRYGYASESAFSTAFRRNLGISPRSYRERRAR